MSERRDYSWLRRREVAVDELGEGRWDVFLSAFDSSDRVRSVFAAVDASLKYWIIHPEYAYVPSDYPSGDVFVSTHRDEALFWRDFLVERSEAFQPTARVCVDITGMMRPHLMLLPKLLRLLGFSQLDVLYTVPMSYAQGARTRFSQGPVTEVRQVRGFEGVHVADSGDRDVVIVGAGYEDELIRRVAESKGAARKLELFGLPSLQAHMYQENRIQAAEAAEAIGPLPASSILFAPASNPFATAQVLQLAVQRERDSARGLANLYLSPLGTKIQALGFAWYYLCELADSASSLIFPVVESYGRGSSRGVGATSLFHLELDWISG